MKLRLLLSAACLALATGGGAMAESVLMRGNDTDPATLDHHRTSTVSEGNLLRDLYEGLVVEGADGALTPGVAERWTVSDDGLTYSFTLRDNARWSNGDPVTAEDFVFALRRIMDPATGAGYASVLYAIAGAEAVNTGGAALDTLGVRAADARTLEITLANPTPYFLNLLTHQTALPLHRASVEAHGDAFTRPGNMVTNGAFMLESFVPNDRIVMRKNPHFHDAANVALDAIHYIPFEDRSACLRRFEAGEVHICSDVPAEQMAYMRERMGGQLRVAPYLGTYYLPIKTTKPAFSDPRVRQALSMLIDREFIAREVWQGTMLPAWSFVPPGIDNYLDNQPLLAYRDTDPLDREDAALALLSHAGVDPAALSIELRYNSSENNKNTMAAVADMLSQVGISARLNEMEGSSYFNYLREDGDFDMVRAGWIGDYSDPQNFLFLFETGVSFNYPRWSNADYDARLRAAARETDLAARASLLAEAEQIFLEEVPAIPILFYSSRALVSDKVTGWEDNLLDSHGSRWLSLN